MSRLRSSRRFAAAIAAVTAGGLLFAERTLLAQDLTVIRAAVKQRLSLLRTLDVKFHVWEDIEYRILPGEPEPVGDGRMDVHWATDRGRVFLETSQRGSAFRIYYDGKQTVEVEPEPPDASQLRIANIRAGPPRIELLQRVILPDALGATELFGQGNLEAMLSAVDARFDRDWTSPEGTFDIAVACRAQAPSLPHAHLGFDVDRGYALSVRHYTWKADEAAMWIVDEWLTATSALSGEELSVPRRGRYFMHGVGANGTEYRQVIVFEVDAFDLPARIPDERFVAAIPSGAEVWEQPKIAGRPMERSIAGGAAAIEAQAAAAARKAAEAMAELRKSGVTFSGRPESGSWTWTFFLLGIVLVGAALFVRRLRWG